MVLTILIQLGRRLAFRYRRRRARRARWRRWHAAEMAERRAHPQRYETRRLAGPLDDDEA
jgi:hypothetical protein